MKRVTILTTFASVCIAFLMIFCILTYEPDIYTGYEYWTAHNGTFYHCTNFTESIFVIEVIPFENMSSLHDNIEFNQTGIFVKLPDDDVFHISLDLKEGIHIVSYSDEQTIKTVAK